jgi:hypothetical protein
MTDEQFGGYQLGRGGTLRIEHASGKLAQLERMLLYREGRVEENEKTGRSDNFLRAEVSSLRAAVAALRFYREQIDALPGIADALGALLVAVEAEDSPQAEAEMETACATARAVLESWEATL